MSLLDFAAIDCRHCGNLIWKGVSATSRCDIKLDMGRLTLRDELLALTYGIATYEIHRTHISFEATRRTAVRMRAAAPVVLATHTCGAMTTLGQVPPDYFNRAKLSTTIDEECAF